MTEYGAASGTPHRGGRSIADTTPSAQPPHPTAALDRARFGFDLVEDDPDLAASILEPLARPSAGDADPVVRITALRGLGRVSVLRGEMPRADEQLSAALGMALDAELEVEAALARMNLAVVRQALGHSESAMSLLDLAEPSLSGGARGQLVSQRGYIHWMQGQPQRALAAYDQAVPYLRAADDARGLMRVLGNRGVAHTQIGQWAHARHDFEHQLDLARAHRTTHLEASALHNLGWLEGRLGNLPAALSLLALARDAYAESGARGRLVTALDNDQCEVLLQAMLAPEADEIAARVVEAAESSGNTVQVAEARLMRARSLLLMQQYERSIDEALRAYRMFIDADRQSWAARASYFIEQAKVSARSVSDAVAVADADRIAAIADALSGQGWYVEAIEVRVHAGRAALTAGDTDLGRRQLALAARARHGAVAAVRAEAWHATALLRLADGDDRGARRAIEAGLRALDRHRATLGAMELRAHASAHGVELGQLGLRLAVGSGRAADVLVWAERWRAGALALPVPKVDADAELAELRELHAAADDATASRIAAAERAVTAKARLVPGDPRSVVSRVDVRALRKALVGRALVEYVELDDALHAVVVTASRSRLVHLGAASRVHEAHDHLVFALRRLSMLPAHHPALNGATAALATAAAEIDALLVAPLRLPDGPIVIVPTGGLHRVAWSALPSLHDRPATVAPSAAWWLGRAQVDRRATSGRTRALLVEGPDLEGTPAELAALQQLLPQATTLTGGEATAERVLAGLANADVAHIAAHGAFRGDNPLFSSLRVADGPIWVHDLARLGQTPRLVILTACEAGRSGVLAGDELLGTATALLSLGVETVIAPLLPVPDMATARFAIRLHHHLSHGATPAEARAYTAADERASGDPTGLAVASTFQCIGNRRSDEREH